MKRVMLIMPSFFNYPQIICEEIRSLGYEVDFFDDRPSTNPWMKAAIRVRKELVSHTIKQYFNSIMETVRKRKYDIVFLISGQSLSFTEDMIQELKDCQPQARFYLYQWDSIKNFPYITRMQKYFDKCYSFDRDDAQKNPNLTFLPLFYSKQYQKIGENKRNKFKYDFCFVGTAHPKKYQFITRMSKELADVYHNQYIYFFFPSRIVYFYRKIVNSELRHAKLSEFHYVPLSSSEMQKVYVDSKCVLDSPQAGQLGLTIRVLEALGAKKKLITTNADVVNYDFYSPENIYVYDEKYGFDFNSPFFSSDYKDIPLEIYRKYSIESWIKRIFEENI